MNERSWFKSGQYQVSPTIAILRALQLGDLLCAVPAWRALRKAYPRAHIALIGLPWAKEFVNRFSHYLDEFIEFPGYPGLPERPPCIDQIPDFIAGLQRRRFEYLLQMQGSGRYANELCSLAGAAQIAGFYTSSEWCPDSQSFLLYPEGIPEICRHMALMEFLGVPASGEELEFPLTERDRLEFQGLSQDIHLQAGSIVCLHPGGRRALNRWAPLNFAKVADELASEGLKVVLTGAESERELGCAVQEKMCAPCVNLVGKTTLGSLGVLLKHARLLVSNDTGVSHMAAALEVPSVVICINSDPTRWSPLNGRLHRVLTGNGTPIKAVLDLAREGLAPVMEASRQTRPVRSSRWSHDPRRDVHGRPLRILTWHIHGNYLFYLCQTPHEFYLPVGKNSPGYAGCAPGFPWPKNVHEVDIHDLARTAFDCILFQSETEYLIDQYDYLTEAQRALPRIFLEHDPPLEDPTDSLHPVDDPEMLLVHVTHYNRLMWDSRRTPSKVIEHGILVPEGVSYTGAMEKGLVIINHLRQRGRRLGADVFDYVRTRVPLDLIGMDSLELGGLGEIGHDRLPEFIAQYRFVFHPIRYTSLGLALLEAMSFGIPPVALGTTESPQVIQDGVSGFVGTDLEALIDKMQLLLHNPDLAKTLGMGARKTAHERFNIRRFSREWDQTLTGLVGRSNVLDTDHAGSGAMKGQT
jgi:ADP-heptose:LPS heptosyltransferase